MKTPRLIIIDDNLTSLIPIKEYIEEKLQVSVFMFSDPFAAIQTITNENNIFAVLLDINMPVIDGYEVVQKIREKYIYAPVLFFTEITPTPEMLQKAYNNGIIDYVIKPLTKIEKDIIKNKLSVFLEMAKYKTSLEEKNQKLTQAYKQIDDNLLKYQKVLQNNNISFVITDKDFNIIDRSCKFDGIMGNSGKNLNDYILTESMLKIKEIMMVSTDVSPFSAEIRNNKNNWFLLTGNNINEEERCSYMFTVQEFTEQQKKQKIKKTHLKNTIEEAIIKLSK